MTTIELETQSLKIGHSPDPDDAFMFYGFGAKLVTIPGFEIDHVLDDIQSLNVRAMQGELPVTAISAHAYPYVADKYWIMKTGASMGEGYGPIIVSKKYKTIEELAANPNAVIAQPGKLTTANLLLRSWFGHIKSVEMAFDRIIDAVLAGEVDAGLLIHEGQITWDQYGLNKLADFGTIWEEKTDGLPLPLGLDCVRKDLGEEMARTVSQALRDSIKAAYDNEKDSVEYALQWGRGIDHATGARFVKMYVNDVTIDMGDRGKQALEYLYRLGAEAGITPKVEEIELY
ncbi:MAG TPA: MqnA/MqnD/SBP family protein [Candidatus Kapabacteria bacterium]|jgi:1,4-dihydroxy-6-naphthoate synthase|nr:MqnA/MqnD/SBP family protein [Candidatus Kapabacteria bacterium]